MLWQIKTNSMRKIFRLIPIIFSLLLVGCKPYEPTSKKVPSAITKDNKIVMPFNTEVSLTAFNEKDFEELYPTFNTEILRLHKLFDRYNDFVDSNGNDIVNLKTINESYGTGKVLNVDQDIIDLLNLSIALSNLTEGYFNPTLGELSDTWTYRYEEGNKYTRFSPYCFEDEDPTDEDITSSKEKMIPYNELSSYIVVNDEDNTVEFKKYKDIDKITLSLGAVAKGYAVEEVKEFVETFNVPCQISGGSSSSYSIGTNPNPERDYWLIGIASPYRSINLIAIAMLEINGTYTLSVSGDYESCYKNEDGVLRHHILNPHTGYPENYYRVVSVKSESRSDVLDALSTAIFNIESTDKIMEIVHNVENYFNINIEVLLEKEVDAENKQIKLFVTEGYDQLISKVNTSFCKEKVNI